MNETRPTTPAHRLRNLLRARGPVPFATFMEEALYGEGGYYAREGLPIGEGGDFVTGSSFSPLFGRTTARVLRRLDPLLGAPAELFEVGYGNGTHLRSVVAALSASSPGERRGRRLRGWDRVARPVPEGVERVAGLSELAEGEVHGLVFSYELFDALPVHRLIGREGGRLGELWVALEPEPDRGSDGGGRFGWREGELSDPALAELLRNPDVPLLPGQVADVAPGWAPLYRQLARSLGRGLLVTCDYGYERRRLLDPRIRGKGTLACYRGHRVHRDAFASPGEQDLTAHVDFTALIQAGEEEGLTTVSLTRQALWLTAAGLFEDLREAGLATRQQAMELLHGEGMGEEIRVLVQGRGVEVERALDLAILGSRSPQRSPGSPG
jgi:SAM-dependent MidA family methyltransferase